MRTNNTRDATDFKSNSVTYPYECRKLTGSFTGSYTFNKIQEDIFSEVEFITSDSTSSVIYNSVVKIINEGIK